MPGQTEQRELRGGAGFAALSAREAVRTPQSARAEPDPSDAGRACVEICSPVGLTVAAVGASPLASGTGHLPYSRLLRGDLHGSVTNPGAGNPAAALRGPGLVQRGRRRANPPGRRAQ